MKCRRRLWFLFGAVGLVLLTVQSRNTWLPLIASHLVVSDSLGPADAIVVFAAEEERARHAARLYHRHLAPVILVTGGVPIRSLEVLCQKKVTGAEFTAALLIMAGVPRSAIRVLPVGTSTYEEADAVRRFSTENRLNSLIAVSSPYHMRRVRSTLHHVFRGTPMVAQFSPAQDSEFNVHEWWRREKDFIRVTNEYMKLAYYHLALF